MFFKLVHSGPLRPYCLLMDPTTADQWPQSDGRSWPIKQVDFDGSRLLAVYSIYTLFPSKIWISLVSSILFSIVGPTKRVWSNGSQFLSRGPSANLGGKLSRQCGELFLYGSELSNPAGHRRISHKTHIITLDILPCHDINEDKEATTYFTSPVFRINVLPIIRKIINFQVTSKNCFML